MNSAATANTWNKSVTFSIPREKIDHLNLDGAVLDKQSC